MASTEEHGIATLETIEAALKQIDSKKEDLKTAYDALQSHSSLRSSSFSFSWSDLDTYFSSVQSNLIRRFRLLQSRESVATGHQLGASNQLQTIFNGDRSSCSNPPNHDRVELTVPGSDLAPAQDPFLSHPHSVVVACQEMNSSTQTQGLSVQDPSSFNSVEVRPEMCSATQSQTPSSSTTWTKLKLKPFFKKMDGKALRRYINKKSKYWYNIRPGLVEAMRVAADPGAMVLDAVEDFYDSYLIKGEESGRLRKVCLDLLEVLNEIKPNLNGQVRERAKALALDRKGKADSTGESILEPIAFLNLVVAYGLNNEFDSDELVDYVVVAAKFKEAAVLCRAIGLGDKASASLLENHLRQSKKLAKKFRNVRNTSLMEKARAQEIRALKYAIKVVDEHKLNSMYPRVKLVRRIEVLKKQKAGNKSPAHSSGNMPRQQQGKEQRSMLQVQKKLQQAKQRIRNKCHCGRTNGPASPSISDIPPFQQTHLQQAGLLPAAGPCRLARSTPPIDYYAGSAAGTYGLVGSTPLIASYAGSSAEPYGLPGSTPPFASYAGLSAGPYGFAGAPMGSATIPNPYGHHPYRSVSHIPSGPTEYHPAYYP